MFSLPLTSLSNGSVRKCQATSDHVESAKTEWALQQAFCEGLRTVALGKLYKNEVNIDAIASDDLPSLIDAIFRLTIQDGDLDTGAYLRPQPNDDSLKSSFAALSAEVARLCYRDPARTLRYLLQGPGSVAVFSSIRLPQLNRSTGQDSYGSLVYQFKQYLSIGRHEDALNWAQHATPILVAGAQKVVVRVGVIGLNRSKPGNPTAGQSETYEKIIRSARKIPAFAFSRIDVLRTSTYTYASIFNILGVIERLLRIDLEAGIDEIGKEVAAELGRSHQARSISMPLWTGEGNVNVGDEDDEGDGSDTHLEKAEWDRLADLIKGTVSWLMATKELRKKIQPSAVLIGKIWTRLYFSLVKSADVNRGKKGAATIMEFYALCVINALLVEEHDHHNATLRIPIGSDSTFRNNPSTSSDRIIKKIANDRVKSRNFPLTFIIGGCPLLLGLLPADEKYRPLFRKMVGYWNQKHGDPLYVLGYNPQGDTSLNAAYIAGATKATSSASQETGEA